jgi:hypothetical protein
MAKGRPPPAFLQRGKAAPPARAAAPRRPPPFERGKRDVEPPGMTEGSPAEEALDRQQMSAFRGGGKVGGKGKFR